MEQTLQKLQVQNQQLQAQHQQLQAQHQQLQAQNQQLQVQNQQLQVQNQRLEMRIHELEARLSKDSSNSSKPPGSDGFKKKTKSLRSKSERKQGAQKGHIGKTLSQVSNPDQIITHVPEHCQKCGHNLIYTHGSCAEKRQVMDIPLPKIEVIEHQVIEKKCPCCGKENRGVFPESVKGPTQYGDKIRALAVYFCHQHFIPVDRVCQIFEEIFNISISPGTCANIDERLYHQLESFEESLKAHLLASKVLHFDETGMRCEKKLYWLHVASSDTATLYTIHPKRGKEAMEAIDILPQFQGTAVHDHWFSYFAYEQITHALCNAHHLRELTFIHEQEKEVWAKEMKNLLIFAKTSVEKQVDQHVLLPSLLHQIEQQYDQTIAKGLAYHALLPPLPHNKRGKRKQREGKNLLDRLQAKKDCVLRFMYDFSVPFTNNLGEQDIRMAKLKKKISGCFRTFHGGQVFCRIRSYISTARKQGWGIWRSLVAAINGRPFQLNVSKQLCVHDTAA